jgi:hypothetical protein
MAVFKVSSAADLVRALGSASGGDEIVLTPGVYAGVKLAGINIPGGVTIRSADPANPAVFQGLRIEDSSGLRFSNLTFEVDPNGGHYQNHVLRSSDIHFSHSSFHGSLNNDPSDDKNGLFFQNSQNVSVSYSEFQQLANGIVHFGSTGLAFVGNSFHNIRSDGIKGGGSSDVLISQNYFRDFFPASGDHPDAIQFWTTNTTSSASNIRILDNVIIQGNGQPIQGIFMGNELKIPYQNVTISGNFVYAGFHHGLTISVVEGVEVHGNTVLSSTERKSPIRVNHATDAEVTGNTALLVFLNRVNITADGSTATPAVTDGGQFALQEWMAARSASLADLPDMLGAGAPKAGTPQRSG